MKRILIGLLVLIAIPIVVIICAFIYHMSPLFHTTSQVVTSYAELNTEVENFCILPDEELLPNEYNSRSMSVSYSSILKTKVISYHITYNVGTENRSISCDSLDKLNGKYYDKSVGATHPINDFNDSSRDIPLRVGQPVGAARTDRHYYSFYLDDFRYSVHAETKTEAAKLAHNIIDQYLDD